MAELLAKNNGLNFINSARLVLYGGKKNQFDLIFMLTHGEGVHIRFLLMYVNFKLNIYVILDVLNQLVGRDNVGLVVVVASILNVGSLLVCVVEV